MGSYTGTIPTFLAGELPDADKFTEISNFGLASTGAWTDYSSSLVITASTTNPTKGNSVYTARYNQVGKMIDYVFDIAIGSTFSAGSGTYSFSLPVTAHAAGLGFGFSRILDGGVAYYVAWCYTITSTTLAIIQHGAGNILGSAGPGTAWASGDSIKTYIRYEAA